MLHVTFGAAPDHDWFFDVRADAESRRVVTFGLAQTLSSAHGRGRTQRGCYTDVTTINLAAAESSGTVHVPYVEQAEGRDDFTLSVLYRVEAYEQP